MERFRHAYLCLAALTFAAASNAPAATLKVGPGATFAVPSAAFQAAQDGDIIEIAPGTYPGDVATIHANKLTIRGLGPEHIKIPAAGKHAGGKAIWVTTGHDLTIENIEFSGARVPDHNGAGIRAEGANLTLRNCRFYDCEDGILGGNGEMLIEHCQFAHCGPVANPATHSLYIGERCTRLIFQYNYSTDVIEGHLLKSRARASWLLYNRLTDENGTGSAVADFPNGGYVVLLGNILHKGPKAQNTRVIAYGMEGIKHETNALFVVHNTMVYENHRGGACFVNVQKTADDFVPVIRNNLCVGKIPLTNRPNADATGNLLLPTLPEAKFLDAAKYDYHLRPNSPAIDKAVAAGQAGDFDLTPKFQYVHPAQAAARPATGLLDIGALEYQPTPH
ncbi:MAG: right-handed parallel beta-helix repeat-containing protein [Phycisphaerae bacterium]